MNAPVLGAVLGGCLATGVVVSVAAAPPLRRPGLERRLSPYLRDTARESSLLSRQVRVYTPFPTLERLLRPALADLARWLDRALGGAGPARRRLDQLGEGVTVEEFRAEQLVWGGAGLAAGVVLSLVLVAGGRQPSPVFALLCCVALAVGGVMARDRVLSSRVRAAQQRMLAEFPTVAELLALAVAAGEGPVGSLERITRLCRGELSRELGRVLADARAGTPLLTALDRFASRCPLPEVARFVDGMAIAVERGTPLADVLRAQAADVRESGKRRLMEASGKKEIAMMVPVVFLVLPVTIAFLLFPGIFSISQTVP